MIEYPDTFFYKLRFALVGMLMIASLLLLAFLTSFTLSNTVQAKSANSSSSSLVTNTSDDANIISSGLFTAVDGVNKTMETANIAVKSTASSTLRGTEVAARIAQSGATTAIHGVGRGFALMFSIPANLIDYVSDSSAVGAIIRPSDHEESVPIIDPDSQELLAALATMPAENNNVPASKNNVGPLWPIHGEITTEFGVPHWPYQITHTGLDISDGKATGITQVRPFRPGKVIEAVHSNDGFGNHVIIDHGNGVTSLYGHLDSFRVQVGQEVTTSTVIGLEGTTGVSTGVHLHFEIRVNGQAANPHQFVSGQP
ncbi:M23 family metallopeptidase [Candidatus Saccharibacteria bacterium]|nr:M23 family metallopeptidase [Candidatus Saccharibacteria bacterium]